MQLPPTDPPQPPEDGANDEALWLKISELEHQHRDLDDAISAMQTMPAPQLLKIQRLKKLKLHLKERIQRLKDRLNPDIIA